MEQANQITLSEPRGLSAKQQKCWEVLTVELAKCALHSRQEIEKADVLVRFESLRDKDPECLRRAIVRCREKFDWIPKIHEIENEYEPPVEPDRADRGNLIEERREPWNDKTDIVYQTWEHGRTVKFRRKADA